MNKEADRTLLHSPLKMYRSDVPIDAMILLSKFELTQRDKNFETHADSIVIINEGIHSLLHAERVFTVYRSFTGAWRYVGGPTNCLL